ncbi:sigma-54 dependent transcriptional regulator [Colwellia sp. BRX8-9]|uniref:sigma-54-dependent transcriptional regulator n=1 Tax=Colwellia sp. BRX8-9 TaxID=2759831 RepID=UPI0015F48117|nr:sigma-54 dependent transcriptional regulator [Colwellia sp. BRX8-9]MBA6350274.1 sigma-54-dependent Fis family transcriptional regulator [Colwellia sp. BRX8-9]
MSKNSQKTLVYIVEDSVSSGALYSSQLESIGYETRHFVDGYSALAAIKEKMPSVIIQDVCLPDISGLDVLQFVKRQKSPARVIIITSNSSIEVAVDAMRLGGFDFIEKPFTRERMVTSVYDAIKQINLETEPPAVEDEVSDQPDTSFLGESLAMKTVFRLLDSAARSKASVFVTGESGTGKEVCAQYLHNTSARKNGPVIAINCAAIPKDLFESEFFGHMKGSFSGALADRKGAVEVANGGTLFLDEICEMDLNLQSKLLRFLQTGTFSRVGSSDVIQSDVRVVCATNRNPAAEVGEGRFREDLYYRLNVIPVQLPALRDRGPDILLLANAILLDKNEANDKGFQQFSSDVQTLFMKYDWPGNIRELQNVIENMVVINTGTEITIDMLPESFGQTNLQVTTTPSVIKSETKASTSVGPTSIQEIVPMWIVEKNTIEKAIEVCDGNIPLAAAHLGVSASTIYRKMKNWD